MGYLRRVTPNKETTQNIKFDTNSKGKMLDANTKEVLEPGKVDRGHKYGFEERVMRLCAEKCHMSQKDYRNMMQNPHLFQWESTHNNRSGKFECKDFSVQLHNCMEVIRNYYGKQRSRPMPNFKETDFSSKLKSNDKNTSVRNHSNVKATNGTKTISGAKTALGRFSAAKDFSFAKSSSGQSVSGNGGYSGSSGHGGSEGSSGGGHGGHGGK